MGDWKGVIIEESLGNKELLEDAEIVGRYKRDLESEGEKGLFHFYKVRVSDDVIEKVIRKGKSAIKRGWYIHLCKDDLMVIIYKDRSFRHIKGDKESLVELRDYGKSIGIGDARLPDESFLENPWA
ncbi:MAG: hypothetical protein JW727_04440 [Candidatus Aenigmarchaeota archaeon]|nr:hypothetical protein [Candidatus Aenigmarchaeota archaeon]